MSFTTWGTGESSRRLRNVVRQAEEHQCRTVETDEVRLPIGGGHRFDNRESRVQELISRVGLMCRGKLLRQDELIFPGLELFGRDVVERMGQGG